MTIVCAEHWDERWGEVSTNIKHARPCVVCGAPGLLVVPEESSFLAYRFAESHDPEAEPRGVWFVYGVDKVAYPSYLAENELEARRFAMENNMYEKVMFWAFGTKFEAE